MTEVMGTRYCTLEHDNHQALETPILSHDAQRRPINPSKATCLSIILKRLLVYQFNKGYFSLNDF